MPFANPPFGNAPDFPFPIEAPFRVVADIYPLGRPVFGRLEEGHFRFDKEFRRYQARKLWLLRRDAGFVRPTQNDDPEGLVACLWRVLEVLANEHPAVARFEDGGVSLPLLGLLLSQDLGLVVQDNDPVLADVQAWLLAQQGLARLMDAVALTLQEDYVVLRGDCSEAFHVAFPSHWQPPEKLGLSFAQVHRPIPQNGLLVQHGPRVAQAMVQRGPFVRFVWVIAELGSLELARGAHAPLPPGVPGGVFLRTERQTTLGLGDLGRSVFTIRVYVQPFAEALQDPARRALLAQALVSMSPEMVEYKGMAGFYDEALAWLENPSQIVDYKIKLDNL